MLASATELRERFASLCERPVENQTQFFLRSFVHDLKDVDEVLKLQAAFLAHLKTANEDIDLSPLQAATFLEKNGKTRTALQRKNELKDVDLDQNGRISFIEYLLLHFKVMILDVHYRRTGKKNPHDLSNDGVGLTGVGNELLTELFYITDGIPLALQKQIDAFMEAQREREAKIEKLKEVVKSGGTVAAGKAARELKILESSDWEDEKFQLRAQIRMARTREGSSTEVVARQKAEIHRQNSNKLQTAKSNLQLMRQKYANNARKGLQATIHRG